MSTEISLDVVKSQLTPQQRLIVDENTINEIQKLGKDPAYGEEFLDSYLMNLNVLKDHVRANHKQYVNAVKFFILVESGNALVDAYIKVFPERYEERNRNLPAEERGKDAVMSEASRFNKSVMVNEIRNLSTVPVQLIHRNLLHEAILEQAKLMRNAKSEVTRQRAGETLIRELKPSEEHQISVKVEDSKATDAIEALLKAAESLAEKEQKVLSSGVALKDIADVNIIEAEIEEVDGDE